jgi:hypothetical protein
MQRRIHPLQRWLIANEWSQAKLAREARISEALVSMVVNWKVIPGRKAAMRIRAATLEEETLGSVTLDELFCSPQKGRT